MYKQLFCIFLFVMSTSYVVCLMGYGYFLFSLSINPLPCQQVQSSAQMYLLAQPLHSTLVHFWHLNKRGEPSLLHNQLVQVGIFFGDFAWQVQCVLYLPTMKVIRIIHQSEEN